MGSSISNSNGSVANDIKPQSKPNGCNSNKHQLDEFKNFMNQCNSNQTDTNANQQDIDIPNKIIQRKRSRYEIEQIKKWQNSVLNKTNLTTIKSSRGMLWYYAIGNDLNISWNAYENHYKVTKNQLKDYNLNNKQNTGIQSIFTSNNHPSYCEGLKRKKSILRDVSRMYSYNNNNSNNNNNNNNLESVLMAYCNYNKNVSYTQFMTHLVEMLLKYQSSQRAFICLCNMLDCELFDMFVNINMNKIQQRVNIFTQILEYNAIELGTYFQQLTINNRILDAYIMECGQSLFTIQLSKCEDIILEIWDRYFIDGEIIIWKAAVTLLIILNEKLFIVEKQLNINEVTSILQSIDKLLVNMDVKCFVNKLNQIKLPLQVSQLFTK